MRLGICFRKILVQSEISLNLIQIHSAMNKLFTYMLVYFVWKLVLLQILNFPHYRILRFPYICPPDLNQHFHFQNQLVIYINSPNKSVLNTELHSATKLEDRHVLATSQDHDRISIA